MVKTIIIWAFYFKLWQLRNHCKRYSAGKPILIWSLHHYVMIPVCGTFQGYISSRLPQNRLLIWKLSLPLFFPFCLLVQTSLTLENDACSGITIKSVVSTIECALCWSPTAYCSSVTSPSKKLHLLSALAFVYFSLRKNSQWRSFSLVYFCIPSSNTIYFTFIFHSDIFKMSTKRGTLKELLSCIFLFHLSFELPRR